MRYSKKTVYHPLFSENEKMARYFCGGQVEEIEPIDNETLLQHCFYLLMYSNTMCVEGFFGRNFRLGQITNTRLIDVIKKANIIDKITLIYKVIAHQPTNLVALKVQLIALTENLSIIEDMKAYTKQKTLYDNEASIDRIRKQLALLDGAIEIITLNEKNTATNPETSAESAVLSTNPSALYGMSSSTDKNLIDQNSNDEDDMEIQSTASSGSLQSMASL